MVCAQNQDLPGITAGSCQDQQQDEAVLQQSISWFDLISLPCGMCPYLYVPRLLKGPALLMFTCR